MPGADLRPSFAEMAEVFGQPVVVTRPAPDDTPIDTEGIWMSPDPAYFPSGLDIQREGSRQVLALPLADVPTVPVTPVPTRFVAAEYLGGDEKRWRAVDIVHRDWDHIRVLVIPDPE